MIYEYKGRIYPDYLKSGAASKFIEPVARHFCKGQGLDIGCGAWPLEGAQGIDINVMAHDSSRWGRADDIKADDGSLDYIFSSHCLEHLENPVAAIEHWKRKIKPGGVLFLYLPHPEMEYWLPQNCRKHLHVFSPEQMRKLMSDLGFCKVISSQRDMYWSFSVVGFNG